MRRAAGAMAHGVPEQARRPGSASRAASECHLDQLGVVLVPADDLPRQRRHQVVAVVPEGRQPSSGSSPSTARELCGFFARLQGVGLGAVPMGHEHTTFTDLRRPMC